MDMHVRALRTAAMAALLCCAVLFLCGCGKKGAPVPDQSRDTFAFSGYSAVLHGGGLNIEGDISGAFQNVEYVVLELQPVDGELCEGCPFLAQEQKRFDAKEIWTVPGRSAISLSYRPLYSVQQYRLRLVAHNMYHGFPDIIGEVLPVSDTKNEQHGQLSSALEE